MATRLLVFAGCLLWLPVLLRAEEAPEKPADKPVLFETDVLPILKSTCGECHSAENRNAELDLTTLAGVRKGSESGEILEPGKVEASLLYEVIHDGYMPPEEAKKKLTKAEIATIRRWIASGAEAKQEVAEETLNQHDVIPILNLRCTTCHGLRRQEAGLDLRTKAAMLKGGKSGPAIVPGKPEESLILKRIHAKEMPPPKLLIPDGVRPVEATELETLTKWIAQGAPVAEVAPDVAGPEPDPLVTDEDREFWAFQPPKKATVPKVKESARVRNEIDAFLLAKLEEKGLSYSDEAERLTLIRRVAFDLMGLPPKWEDVERYLADDSPDAYEAMVERYLASPHYGERWGQYWLDLAGYADSEGKRSADPLRPHAWRYRDYVIRAFNNDKPYDRFLLEQIAGDELADYENAETVTPQMMDNLVATGFLRMAPDGTGSDIVNTAAERLEVINDELNVFGSGILGLTIKCAQCHSHKYDPIPQRDYYRLMAVFKGAYDEHDWLKPSFVPGQTKAAKPGRVLSYVSDTVRKEWEADQAQTQARIDELNAEIEAVRQEAVQAQFEKRAEEVPEDIREDVLAALVTPEEKRSKEQKAHVKKYEKRLKLDDRSLRKSSPEFDRIRKDNGDVIKQLNAQLDGAPAIRALWDRGTPSPTYIYRRGEFTNPGRLVGPGVPSVLTDGETPFEVEPPWPGAKKTGRRLALAKWLIEPDHPLTARVMVNRIWRYHFGRGIVKTLDNFGNTGARPTHPELLDWLARRFVAEKWSIKAMHRLMMTSSAYRQVSTVTEKLERLDPENVLLSRMPLRRMEAEVVRDSIVAISGRFDARPYGRPDPVKVRADGLVTSKPAETGWRRSIYVRHRRKEMPTILETFDMPQMIPNCIERPTSTVASQALHLMNDGMIRELSKAFAERVETETGGEPYRQVHAVYRIALSRLPTDDERELGIEAINELRRSWQKQLGGEEDVSEEAASRALETYCHTIVNSAAFLYID